MARRGSGTSRHSDKPSPPPAGGLKGRCSFSGELRSADRLLEVNMVNTDKLLEALENHSDEAVATYGVGPTADFTVKFVNEVLPLARQLIEEVEDLRRVVSDAGYPQLVQENERLKKMTWAGGIREISVLMAHLSKAEAVIEAAKKHRCPGADESSDLAFRDAIHRWEEEA